MSGNTAWVPRKYPSTPRGRALVSRPRRWLALAVCVLAIHGLLKVAEASPDNGSKVNDEDQESDNAPFAVVVQHDSETDASWHCGGSLVSMRSALTSRWCARGRELWLLAAPPLAEPDARARVDGKRRVSRVVFANELGGMLPSEMDDSSDAVADDAWSGASLDLALLEMESPFGAGASARPILMATAAADCGHPAACHAAGVRPRGDKALLRIVDLEMARGDVCSDVARHWAAVRDHVLCLTGTELCRYDRGAGVVCNGKLCGVMSRSARAGLERGTGCGDLHAAQSVPRWRRFVQCAHTTHSCSRDAQCTELCTERLLLPEMDTSASEPETSRMVPPPPTAAPRLETEPSSESAEETTTKIFEPVEITTRDTELSTSATSPYIERITAIFGTTYELRIRAKTSGRRREDEIVPTRSEAPSTSPPQRATQALLRPASAHALPPPRIEYDPSRADFKAGEYGDNAADYAGLGEDGAGGGRSSKASSSSQVSPAAPPTRSPPAPRRPAPALEHQAAAPALSAEFTDLASVKIKDDMYRVVHPVEPEPASSSKTPSNIFGSYFLFYIAFVLY